MKEKSLVTLLVIILVIIIAVVILTRSHPESDEELAKCIGTKAELYSQLGCHACETQEKIFGDNYQYLNVIDCFFEQEKCIQNDIRATPTWIINGEQYLGAHPINKLKELTGC